MKTVLIYGGLFLTFITCLFANHVMAQPVHTESHDFPKEIEVGYYKTTTLVFGTAIRDADRGSADIIIRPLKKFPYILKIKAARENFTSTNVTVYTADGNIFPVDVRYAADPAPNRYDFTDRIPSDNFRELTAYDKLNEEQIKLYAQYIPFLKSGLKKPHSKRHSMLMQLRGVYIQNGILFFNFRIHNDSNIPYDIAFSRFYERDRSQARRTTSVEKELHPLYVHFTKEEAIGAKDYLSMVVAFDKFTIADNKYFIAELFEQNGDRHLSVRLKGKNILKAKPLPPELLYAQSGDSR